MDERIVKVVANCRIKVSQRVTSASAVSRNEALCKDLVSDDIPTVPTVHFAPQPVQREGFGATSLEGAERGGPSHLNADRLSCTSRLWQTRHRKQAQHLDTRAK